MVKKFWGDIDNAAISAVLDRSRAYQCGLISFKAIGGFLYMKLPSGRKISYPMPRTIQGEYGLRVVFSDNAHGFMPCKGGFGAYGGLWAENAASGTARDILAEAMLRLEAAGYPIVLHCHDEITAEVPVDFGTVAEFTELMTRSPSWAEGLPIAAEAWTGQRYTK